MASAGRRIVLTADRSLMTNYRGNFLYGFIACGPYELIPEVVFDKLFCPSVETDRTTGEVKVAQCGLRRIESALLREYDRSEVFLANPEMLDKCVGPETRVVGLNVMDPLGMAPVTTTMSPEKLSYIAMKFKKMCASINSLIETMRRCGRGCDFCDVNKRSKKDMPLARLQTEASFNLRYGFDSIWLQSDEMLLYGCDNKEFVPNSDAILDLWKGLKSLGANFVGTTHMTLSAVASSPDLIRKISEVNDMDKNGRWLATNLGVETVAPSLVKKHLGVKTKPFQTDEWGAVVREGCKIMNQNHWFPALTLIIGWPDETPDETQYTIDLIDDFRHMSMRGLVAPLLYQDFSEKNSMHFGNLNEAQFTLFWRCWEHNLRVINDIIPIIIRNKTYGPAMKVFMAALIKSGTWAVMRYLRGLSKELFNGQVPEDIVERYSRKQSVTATMPSRL